jgi:uncharacterized protein YuzE
MKFSYDPRYNIAYIRFQPKSSGVDSIKVSDELIVDMSSDGTIYGIELLNANEQLGSQRVKKLIFENRQSGKKSRLALAG